MERRCRLILDAPAGGAWNMAVDEALLKSAMHDPSRGPTLRLYRWQEPTLSLGYFQNIADRPKELAHLFTVRRLTGGGGIVHDRELTYSLVFPKNCWPRERFLDHVRDAHEIIRSIFRGLNRPVHASEPPEPFLCFERRSLEDLVLGDQKIVGSAQRNRHGTLLQHGSILLSASAEVPHLTGLLEGKLVDADERLMDEFPKRLAELWDWSLEPGELDEREFADAKSLEEEKYRQAVWNERR